MSRTLLLRLCAILLLVILALIGTLVGVWLRQRRPARLAPHAIVAFLDVGDGDCTLIRDPNGTTVLLDAGSRASGPQVVSTLRRFHVQTVDLLVLASGEEGSIGGVPAVVAAFPVRQVWDGAEGSREEPRRTALEAIRRRHIPPIVHAGDNLQIGSSMFWKTLWPPEQDPAARQDGLLLEMDYGMTHFLFAGTAPATVEGNVVAGMGDSLGCTTQCSDLVLQVPRGGADTGTSAELLRSAAPSVAVISCSGVPNSPAQTTLHRLQAAGAEIRRTDTMGTVIVSTDGRTAPSVTAEHL